MRPRQEARRPTPQNPRPAGAAQARRGAAAPNNNGRRPSKKPPMEGERRPHAHKRSPPPRPAPRPPPARPHMSAAPHSDTTSATALICALYSSAVIGNDACSRKRHLRVGRARRARLTGFDRRRGAAPAAAMRGGEGGRAGAGHSARAPPRSFRAPAAAAVPPDPRGGKGGCLRSWDSHSAGEGGWEHGGSVARDSSERVGTSPLLPLSTNPAAKQAARLRRWAAQTRETAELHSAPNQAPTQLTCAGRLGPPASVCAPRSCGPPTSPVSAASAPRR